MSRPEDLKAAFSFIGAFQAETVLAPYTLNALPLFAVALYLGIEDLASFATDSLTDGPNDKKADIIYIDEAEGIACIAQGTTATDWGKTEALANKASDLNTAVAWLLQQPIVEVPEKIRGHAELLREGLNQGTITKLIFAYAHNAYESANVERELQATRELVNGLEITKQCDVEVVELGLSKIEALYLASPGTIQVTHEFQFPAAQYIKEEGCGWKAFVISINGAKLFDLYEAHQSALFSANLRDFLGARRATRHVNNTIKTTAESESGVFYIFNNGITIVCNKADHENETLYIHGISVVNGAQTTGAIHAAGRQHASKVTVVARVIVVEDDAMIPRIVAANNTQNAIVAWDSRSNDVVQRRLGREFGSRGIQYIHRRDNTEKSANRIMSDRVGQMLCAFSGDLQTAIRAKANIFEIDATYNEVFPVTLGIGHVFGVQTLGWAYDQVKQELKTKSSSGSMTELERQQLNLLDYPASKQFLIRLMGDLREEIAGRSIPNRQEFALNDGAITADGTKAITAWVSLIKAVLPTIVQSLPDEEEYRVVRSTEHTNDVVRQVKGIVAGVPVMQTSFESLRALLKPV